MHPSRKLRTFGYFNGQNKLQNICHVIDSVKSEMHSKAKEPKLS